MASSPSAGTESPPAKTAKPSPPDVSKPQSVVTIIVSGKNYIVHKEIICYYSPFFETAFNGKFMESETQEMKLPEVTEAVFAIFVHWLYYQNFALPATASSPRENSFVALINLWLLGEQWLMPDFCASLIHYLSAMAFCNVPNNELKAESSQIFESVAETPLQSWFVDKMIQYGEKDSKKVKEFVKWFPINMLQQITARHLDVVASREAGKKKDAVKIPMDEDGWPNSFGSRTPRPRIARREL